MGKNNPPSVYAGGAKRFRNPGLAVILGGIDKSMGRTLRRVPHENYENSPVLSAVGEQKPVVAVSPVTDAEIAARVAETLRTNYLGVLDPNTVTLGYVVEKVVYAAAMQALAARREADVIFNLVETTTTDATPPVNDSLMIPTAIERQGE